MVSAPLPTLKQPNKATVAGNSESMGRGDDGGTA
jgi:hypothetical protein